jgi:glycerol-3-phosphate acyltransferase PlsX
MRIALDAMGGDYAPQAVLQGALMAKESFSKEGKEIVLIGNQTLIHSHFEKMGVDKSAFEIVHTEEVIGMGEHPTKAIGQKPNSSIMLGFKMLKEKSVDAFCSAGNTGAMLVGSLFTIKAIPGIDRPGIAGFIPKEDGRYGILLDVGANADCKPEFLDQFAVLGSLYSKYIFNIENPKVGLMNLGEEEQKGTILTQATHQLLKNNNKINFIGNIEGRDAFNDKADVIVTDGFTGNVILKLAETFYELMEKRNFMDPFIELFNYAGVGGSPILGVNGNVIIGHGVSTPIAIKNMLNLAVQLTEAGIVEKIKNAYN